MSKMPVLVIGDAVIATGFARVIHSILERLASRYEFHHLGINYNGDPHKEKWKIYPAQISRGDVYGVSRLEHLIEKIRPRAVFLINDVWVLANYAEVLSHYRPGLRVIAYFPIDSDPIEPAFFAPLVQIVDVWVTYTEFARGGILSAFEYLHATNPAIDRPEVIVIPHGIDPEKFYPIGDIDNTSKPRQRHIPRKKLFPNRPDLWDAFIVLNANRNQPRKRIDITLESFAIFARNKPPSVKLYLHMARQDAGWDIFALARRFGIQERLLVTVSDNGFPNISTKQLNYIYNSCDVGINTSSAEGWGLVSFEHAATKAAQIVPCHTTQIEIWSGAAELIRPRFLLVNEKVLTNAYLVAAEDVADALEHLYTDPPYRCKLEQAAYNTATQKRYHWDTIATQWDNLFQQNL
jgi:glycosyltransferase involved in cell wall biosynthesis